MSLNPFKNKSYVGVDIGHNSIKVVQLDKTAGGWRIVKTASIATPSDSIKEGIVTDIDAVALSLKAALRDHKINATAAIIGVAGATVIVRSVHLPKMNELMLRKSIKYEAGRYVPSSIEDSFIEFEILGDAPEDQMEVLIVAAPKDVVNSRVAVCEKIGLDVDIVDVEAFAMYRSLVEADQTSMFDDMTLALVDIGAKTTNVSVINRGSFMMTRTITQAGEVLTEALKNYFKLESADAESGKAQLDLTPLTTDAVLDNQPLRVLQPHIDDLIREVRRSLNYYQTQQNNGQQPSPVSHLVISGGGANLGGLAAYMAHKLGVQVVTMGALDNPSFTDSTGELDHGLEYAVATGLAMRGFSKAA